MKRTNRFSRNIKLTAQSSLALKLLVAITSGLAFIPGVSWAASIETEQNKVLEVSTQRFINADIGVNNFDRFDVAANSVVNLKFDKMPDQKTDNPKSIDTLVNLVDSKINIAGAVNAIKDDSIGGHLFFLSREGMAVTSTGVINAGSLTVLTPATLPTSDDDIKNIVNDPTQVKLSSNGDITIDGQVNSKGNVTLRAGKSINVSGKIRSGVSSLKKTNKESGTELFTNIVSLNNEQKAGNSGELVATQTSDGDIVLEAFASNTEGMKRGSSEQTAPTSGIRKSAVATINVHENASVKGGKITIKAKSEVKKQAISESNAEVIINGDVEGGSVSVSAEAQTDVQDSMFVPENSASDTVGMMLGGLGVFGPNLDINRTSITNKATITIGESGSVVGKKTSVNMNTSAKVVVDVDTEVSPIKFMNPPNGAFVPETAVLDLQLKNTSKVVINGSVGAKTILEVFAQAEQKVNAGATSRSYQIQNGGETALHVAVLNTNLKNHADVVVGSTAKFNEKVSDAYAGGAFINANAKNDLIIHETTRADDAAALVIGVNVHHNDSHAKVEMGAGITTKGSLRLNATNTFTHNDVDSANQIGANMIERNIRDVLFKILKIKQKDPKSLDGKNKKSFFDDLHTILTKGRDDASKSKFDKWLEKIGKENSGAIGVQYINQNNTSSVIVKKGVHLKAEKDLTITALTDIQDHVFSSYSSSNDGQQNTVQERAGTVALSIADVVNDSLVLFEGDELGKGTQVSAKNILIEASTEMPYTRPQRIWQDIVNLWGAMLENAPDDITISEEDKAAIKKLSEKYIRPDISNMSEEDKKAIKDIKDKYNGSTANMTAEDRQKIEAINAKYQPKDLSDLTEEQAKEMLEDIAKVGGSIEKFSVYWDGSKEPPTESTKLEKAKAFFQAAYKTAVIVANYPRIANYAVRAETSDSNNKAKEISFSGSFSITDIQNSGRVLVGSSTKLHADNILTIEGKNKGESIGFVGNSGLIPFTKSSGSSIGGNVISTKLVNNALVMVGKNADLAAKFVGLHSNNHTMQANIAFAAGKAGKKGISGMVVIGQGESNSLVLVDDEARIEAYVRPARKKGDKGDNGSVLEEDEEITDDTDVSLAVEDPLQSWSSYDYLVVVD